MTDTEAVKDSQPPSLRQLVATTKAAFKTTFGRDANLVVAAPGRVNLIGEHIDYNDGFVLPLALERQVVIAAALPQEGETSTRKIRVHSTELSETQTIGLDEAIRPGRKGWVCYIEGVVAGFIDLQESVPAFDAVVGSNIPVGAGLSSSAALEVATATLLEQITDRILDPRDKALLCQTAEHSFAGVPCGIMDQFSSVFGRTNELMLIDCRSQAIEWVPFDPSQVSVLITNSNVKHKLVDGEYAKRRSQCDSALKKLEKTTWRDVAMENLEHGRDVLTETEHRRASHVISEISRTRDAAKAIRSNDWETVGRLMYDSHSSLRDNYEVSCRELDLLVKIARELGSDCGVFGARMTGGGFGGCTVSLVENEKLDSVIQAITLRYKSATGITPQCFSSPPARGAYVLEG